MRYDEPRTWNPRTRRYELVRPPRPSRVWPLLLLALLVMVCGAVCATGCAGLPTVQPRVEWIRAERATCDVLAPEFAAYVLADPALDEAQRQNRLELLADWNLRIQTAEDLLGLEVAP